MLPKTLSSFIRDHWVLGGIATSLLWFVAGRQSLANKKPDFAILWQSVGVLVILAMCGWAVVEREWLGAIVGVVVLYYELRSIKHIDLGFTGAEAINCSMPANRGR